MSDSFLSSLVFWSMGYGAVMGFGIAPVLMLEASSWCTRLAIVGFAVPICSLATTTLILAFYMYGNIVLAISNIITQPIFMISIIQTLVLSVTMYSAFLIFKKTKLLEENKVTDKAESKNTKNTENTEVSENESENSDNTENAQGSENESENESENSDNTENTEVSENESENSDNIEGSENESENSDNTEDIKESKKTSDNEWRKRANFEGIRNASPLPE